MMVALYISSYLLSSYSLSPYLLVTTGHGLAVDWWALGTLLYEVISIVSLQPKPKPTWLLATLFLLNPNSWVITVSYFLRPTHKALKDHCPHFIMLITRTFLLQMLTGLPPYYDTNMQRMYHKILFDPLKFPKGAE